MTDNSSETAPIGAATAEPAVKASSSSSSSCEACPACAEPPDWLDDRCRACGARRPGAALPEATDFYRPWRAVLTLGFGTAVASWAAAYVCRLPAVQAPAPLLLSLFVVCLLGGGFLARTWTRSTTVAVLSGALACLVNLLILGSFLADNKGQALTWIPGTISAGAVLGGLGSLFGLAVPKNHLTAPRSWNCTLAIVALVATLLLLAVGGVVTGSDSGLAVPDWPNSFRSNMFFYPLSRMTGGIYYEHAHRLFGSLVGLTTLVLAITVAITDRRMWLKGVMALAFVFVCAQGVMGGLRVTGGFTLSTDAAHLAPSRNLAALHGVTAQLFFALLVAIAAFLSWSWVQKRKREAGEEAEATFGMAKWTLGLVVAQLVVGALVRHKEFSVSWHILLAVVVVIAAFSCGVRLWSKHEDPSVLPKVGMGLLLAVTFQVVLGVGALATTSDSESILAQWQVPMTTAHQTLGAVVLGFSSLALAWSYRLFELPPRDA